MNHAVVYHSHIAAGWEAGYSTEVYSVRKSVVLDLLADSDLAGQKWLDAGCGTGTLARLLAERKGCDVVGVDASDEMIRNCAPAPHTEYAYINDICKTELAGAAFDGVLCSSVLEFIAEPAAALAEFHRILKKDGMLLISVPNAHPVVRWPVVALYWLTKYSRRRRFEFLDHSRHSYSAAGFCRLLERCGFRVEAVRTFGMGALKRPILGQGSLLMVRAHRV